MMAFFLFSCDICLNTTGWRTIQKVTSKKIVCDQGSKIVTILCNNCVTLLKNLSLQKLCIPWILILNSDWDKIFAFQKNEKKNIIIIVFWFNCNYSSKGHNKKHLCRKTNKKAANNSQKCPFTHTLCNETLFEKKSFSHKLRKNWKKTTKKLFSK